jgi:hypothetical protein
VTINIIRYNPNLLKQRGIVYCGRKSSEELKIGLGNPFSHKNISNAIYKVSNLEIALREYRKWLWKLLKAYRVRSQESGARSQESEF